jgi:hypothetical protein
MKQAIFLFCLTQHLFKTCTSFCIHTVEVNLTFASFDIYSAKTKHIILQAVALVFNICRLNGVAIWGEWIVLYGEIRQHLWHFAWKVVQWVGGLCALAHTLTNWDSHYTATHIISVQFILLCICVSSWLWAFTLHACVLNHSGMHCWTNFFCWELH